MAVGDARNRLNYCAQPELKLEKVALPVGREGKFIWSREETTVNGGPSA